MTFIRQSKFNIDTQINSMISKFCISVCNYSQKSQIMKKLIYFTFFLFLIACSASKNELYGITDSFVKSLQTEYDSYGMFGSEEYTKVTSDGLYQIIPTGRLINVKILKGVSSKDYSDLEEDLKSHYKDDKRVNDVYINNGGTIMIDCRN